MKWIIDMEWYTVHGNIYPIEIALLSVDTRECQVHYIYYPDYMMHKTLTTQYQFKRHGIRFGDGYESLSSAMISMLYSLQHNDDIYVKGFEKANVVREWFQTNNKQKVFHIHEIKNAPSILSFDSCKNTVCHRHRHDLSLCCAQRKVWQLLPYVPSSINEEKKSL